ncbi:MAG: hypothetical protein AB7D06_08815 [Pedobacter sp.]
MTIDMDMPFGEFARKHLDTGAGSNSAVDRLVKSPPVVCLCGSTRFFDAFRDANRAETMEGKIVLAPGVFGHCGDPLTDDDKLRLDILHYWKIDLADEVLVLNVGGYIGSSTQNEIEYAKRTGKPVRFLEAI